MEKQYRYPGARPFTENDRALFFGRETDISLLTQQVALEKLVVLFGKSGYGKTSLLQAGVIPRLREVERHRVVQVRLNEPGQHPLDLMAAQLQAELGGAPGMGEKLELDQELPDDLSSKVWCQLKSLQMASPDNPWVTLVFDSFEELFNFHQPHVESFGRALAVMLDPRPPKAVRRLMKERLLAGGGGLSQAEQEAWFAPLNLKVLLSLRHDHLSSLDSLKQDVPAIFRHTYELQPLSGIQALEALEKPAALEGSYASPPFTFSQAALDKIVSALKDPRTQRIETFQLQLIAQRAEEAIIGKARANPEQTSFELTAAELGNPELVFENHYQEIVGSLPPKDQHKARWLVEKKLIVKGHRVPLPQRVITEQYQVPALLLNGLVERRLLRTEVNSVGGTSFELSHDTLVAPIEKSARKRRQRILQKRLRVAGLVLLLLILAFASWGVYEKVRADGLEEDVIGLETDIQALRDSLDRMKRVKDPDGTLVILTRERDSLAREVEVQQDTVEALREKVGILAGQTPGVRIDTVYIKDDGQIVPRPPIDDRITVTLPSELYSEWIKKLNDLKARVSANPDAEYARVAAQEGASDTRAPDQWSFDPREVHLLAVRINPDRRVFDARNPKAYFVLLIDGKVFKFLGGTGYFTHDGQLAFMAKGQHLMRLGDRRGDRSFVPGRQGVRLIRDVDRDAMLTETDIMQGLYRQPDPEAAIRWSTGSNALTEPGQQLIFNQYYLNPFDRIAPQVGTANRAPGQDAFQIFIGMVWNLPTTAVIHYTLVDRSDFGEEVRREIDRDINRLRTGQ